MVLADFASYEKARRRSERLYLDRGKWRSMSLVNTAQAGVFSADRAIRQYAENIWHASAVPLPRKKLVL
jgi:starch phosphorylase